jgi:GDPmannose 4,6-dehydratase
MEDPGFANVVATVQPAECYHLAARSAVRYDADVERITLATNTIGTLNLLSAIRIGAPACRVCFAASSEMFGNPESAPQTEDSQRNPRSIYGISKLSAFELMRYYRSDHGIFAASAILYNHESLGGERTSSPERLRKPSHKFFSGMASELVLGNMDARRDWGHARDYVDAMWRMLQNDQPSDYVIATGELHSVREFVERAFFTCRSGLAPLRSGRFQPGPCRTGRFRLWGDSRKARSELHWEPCTAFTNLVDEMVDSDRRLVVQHDLRSHDNVPIPSRDR